MNSKFDSYYSSNSDIYNSLNQLLTNIKSNINKIILTSYSETELKEMLDQIIEKDCDVVIEEDIMEESKSKKLLDLVQSINKDSNHDIFLVIIGEYSGNLDSSAEKFAKSYCSSIEKCVFILCDNSKHKIGSYFG